jgi:hypothetical protein
MEYKMNELTYKEVWQTLNALDLSEYHDKKGHFTYLSWTDAWKILMDIYPYATYEFLTESYEKNGTVMSHCIVRIGSLERYMWLPCMDNKNNSLTNPTTRQIQDSRMRCLVKCLAMFGLANYIYRGEDLPSQEKDDAEAEIIAEAEAEAVKDDIVLLNRQGNIISRYVDTTQYVKALRKVLNKPDDEEHRKLFEINKEQISLAYESLDSKHKDREPLGKLIEIYTNEKTVTE